jgi:hypothetical protein
MLVIYIYFFVIYITVHTKYKIGNILETDQCRQVSWIFKVTALKE